jgi:hypothetical protein
MLIRQRKILANEENENDEEGAEDEEEEDKDEEEEVEWVEWVSDPDVPHCLGPGAYTRCFSELNLRTFGTHRSP